MLKQRIKNVLYRKGAIKLMNGMRQIGNRDAVFIWIPKNAGTSIYKTLKTSHCIKTKSTWDVKRRFSGKGLVTFGHMSYRQLLKNQYISEEFHRRSFKFCFVRNPLTRTVSLYNYLLKRKMIPEQTTFAQFCKLLQKVSIEKVGLWHVNGLSMCNPQSSWIRDVEIDFIGRVESIGDDFEKIRNHLGLSTNVNLRRENESTGNKTKLDDILDQESYEIVLDFYKEDFERFKYSSSTAGISLKL